MPFGIPEYAIEETILRPSAHPRLATESTDPLTPQLNAFLPTHPGQRLDRIVCHDTTFRFPNGKNKGPRGGDSVVSVAIGTGGEARTKLERY